MYCQTKEQEISNNPRVCSKAHKACMQTAYRIEMISGKVEKRKEKMIGNGFASKNITKGGILQPEHDRDACSQFLIIITQILEIKFTNYFPNILSKNTFARHPKYNELAK